MHIALYFALGLMLGVILALVTAVWVFIKGVSDNRVLTFNPPKEPQQPQPPTVRGPTIRRKRGKGLNKNSRPYRGQVPSDYDWL
jgi:hypothetical protein